MKTIKLLFASALLAGVFTTGMLVNDVTKVEAAGNPSLNDVLKEENIVKDISAIDQSSKYLITNIGKDKVLSLFDSKYFSALEKSEENVSSYMQVSFEKIENSQQYYISFTNGDDVSYVSNEDLKNSLKRTVDKSASSKWTISFNGEEVVFDRGGSYNKMQYNASAPRFACYNGSQQNLILYKVPNVDLVNITFDYNYDGSVEVLSFEKGTEVIFPENPAREGYKFDGWYDAPEGGNKIESLVAEADKTLYAHWSIDESFSALTTRSSLVANYGYSMKETTIAAVFNDTGNAFSSEKDLGLDSSIFKANTTENNGGSNPAKVYDSELRMYSGNEIEISLVDGLIKNLNIDLDINENYKTVYIQVGEEKYFLSNANENIVINSNKVIIGNDGSRCDIQSLEFNANVNTLNVNSASLRFGATIDKANENYYNPEATYGVIYAPKEKMEGYTFKDNLFLSDAKTAEELSNQIGSDFCFYTPCAGAFVNEENAVEPAEDGKYFQFAVVINGLEKYLAKEITATCYKEYNGTIELMNERTFSVASIAQYYIDNNVLGDKATPEQIAVLNYLASLNK